MRVHEVRSVSINAPYAKVFAYIADPCNLPKWAHAFESVHGSRAVLRTPAGTASVALAVLASAAHGTVDWEMTFADGSVATAMSRLTRAPHGQLAYTFVLNAPPLPLEQIEGALDQQVRSLEAELARLKELVSE